VRLTVGEGISVAVEAGMGVGDALGEGGIVFVGVLEGITGVTEGVGATSLTVGVIPHEIVIKNTMGINFKTRIS
jgi:hypothetical protein